MAQFVYRHDWTNFDVGDRGEDTFMSCTTGCWRACQRRVPLVCEWLPGTGKWWARAVQRVGMRGKHSGVAGEAQPVGA